MIGHKLPEVSEKTSIEKSRFPGGVWMNDGTISLISYGSTDVRTYRKLVDKKRKQYDSVDTKPEEIK